MVVGIVVVDACVLLLWELINPMHVKVNTLLSEVRGGLGMNFVNVA